MHAPCVFLTPHKPTDSDTSLRKDFEKPSRMWATYCAMAKSNKTLPQLKCGSLCPRKGSGQGRWTAVGRWWEPSLYTQSHGFLASLGQGSSTLLNRKWLTKENVRMIQIVAEGGKHLGTFHKHEHDRGISLHSITRRPRQGDTSDWSSGEIY